jgi:hypothetical protein
MDYCCDENNIENRQWRTTLNAWLFWDEYRAVDWCWTPTIQGWQLADYVRHAREMKTLILQMQQHYAGNPAWRVGIGSLCKRADTDMIKQVVLALTRELPDVQFHLWGVKLATLKTRIGLPQVVSADSAAWSPGGLGRSGIEARDTRQGLGLSQAQYGYLHALPAYVDKVNRAVRATKQMPLI